MSAMPVESCRRLLGHKCEEGVFEARGRFAGLPAQVPVELPRRPEEEEFEVDPEEE